MERMNQSVLVILDSRRVAERRMAEGAVAAALEHFGMAWNVYELGAPEVASDFNQDAARDPMAPPGARDVVDGYVGDRALFVLAHDGAGNMPARMGRLIADAVMRGAGLVSLDRERANWPAALRELDGVTGAPERAEQILIADASNPFLILPHAPGEALPLRRGVETLCASAGDGEALLATRDGRWAAWTRRRGKGRVVVFGAGAELFDEAVMGHGVGFTGLLWRSMIWAARKPFATRSIPPSLTARFDDCTGSYDAFGYVRVLNEAGIRPNVGIFIDELSEADWRAAGELCRTGGADFSIHAFRDDLLLRNPGWTAARSMAHKPRFEQVAFDGFTLDHFTGKEFDADTIERNFEIMDRRFARYGVRHSRVINAHFAEVAFAALPHFLRRGADIHVNNGVIGQLYGNQPLWRPRPFGLRSPAGRHPLVVDQTPDRSGAFCAGVGCPPGAAARMETDILWGLTPFIGECGRVDVDGATLRCVRNMEWALDSMAWGLLMAHEQWVACVPPEDWRRLVAGVTGHFRGRDVQFAGREDVAVMTRRLFHSRLVRAWVEGGDLKCELTGCADGPSPLTVWRNEGAGCRGAVREIEAIDGFLKVEGIGGE